MPQAPDPSFNPFEDDAEDDGFGDFGDFNTVPAAATLQKEVPPQPQVDLLDLGMG